jgi:hypothetical protein
MRDARAPDFFLIGAPKSGTTTLYHWLAAHPSIHMSPIREPCFFAPEVVDYTERSRAFNKADAPSLRAWLDGPMTGARSHGMVLDWNDYLSLFRYAGDTAVLGEASGNYLHSWNAPSRLKERIPGARMIVLLRKPADRLFSHFASAVAAGEAGGRFGEWIDEQLRSESIREPRFGPVWTGMYAHHLKRWLAHFPRDRMSIHLYDDYRVDPAGVLEDVFTFLGVDPRHRIDTTRRHNVTGVPRWPAVRPLLSPVARMATSVLPERAVSRLKGWYRGPARFTPTAADRVLLSRIYSDDMRELRDLLARDLSHWIEADA